MILKLMPKDPNNLFVFWETDEDTKLNGTPYLKITDTTTGSSFLVRINSFSNSWYINVPGAGCEYVAEFGYKEPENDFFPICRSNRASTAGNTFGSSTGIEFADYNDIRIDGDEAARHPVPRSKGLTDDGRDLPGDSSSGRKGYNY
jgi:hypothetical protein